MKDILLEAARQYNDNLLNKGYHIVLGKKNKTYELNIRFPKDSFYHLVGLQHLEDISFSTTNKERLYKDILDIESETHLTHEYIKNSIFYDTFCIYDRITNLCKIEHIIDNSKTIFRINKNKYSHYTKIKADFLCDFIDATTPIPNIFYFYLIYNDSSQMSNEYKGCSFFKNNTIDYKQGTMSTTLLLKEKIINIGTPNETYIELFRHKNYIEKKD